MNAYSKIKKRIKCYRLFEAEVQLDVKDKIKFIQGSIPKVSVAFFLEEKLFRISFAARRAYFRINSKGFSKLTRVEWEDVGFPVCSVQIPIRFLLGGEARKFV